MSSPRVGYAHIRCALLLSNFSSDEEKTPDRIELLPPPSVGFLRGNENEIGDFNETD